MTHLIGKKRKFGNDTFTAQASKKKKTDAEKYAENKRKQGFKARVVVAKHPKKGKEYYIFLKKGKAKKMAKQKHHYYGESREDAFKRFGEKRKISEKLRKIAEEKEPDWDELGYRSKKRKPVKRKTTKKKPKKKTAKQKHTYHKKGIDFYEDYSGGHAMRNYVGGEPERHSRPAWAEHSERIHEFTKHELPERVYHRSKKTTKKKPTKRKPVKRKTTKKKPKKKMAKQKHNRYRFGVPRSRDEIRHGLDESIKDAAHLACAPHRWRNAHEADQMRNWEAQESGMYGRSKKKTTKKKPIKRKTTKKKPVKRKTTKKKPVKKK